jgi:CRP/FNR family transcriptional regulator, dissimilatory nitrate respiration regulator
MDGVEQAWQHEPLSRFAPALRDAAQTCSLLANNTLFTTGQRPAWMYFVVDGEAVMSRCDREGRRLILQRASGTFLAEASLRSERYHCDAHVSGDSTLLRFQRDALRAAIDEDAPTRWAWIGMLAAEIRLQRSHAERMALRTVRERLLHLLLVQSDAGGRLRLPGTRKDLAAQLGVSHEALYRAIATLTREQILLAEGNVFRLL